MGATFAEVDAREIMIEIEKGTWGVDATSIDVPQDLKRPGSVRRRSFKVEFTREEDGRQCTYGLTPVELSDGYLVRAIRVKRTREDWSRAQERVVVFDNPAWLSNAGIVIESSQRGCHRWSRGVDRGEILDPALVFSGNKRDRKMLKSQGINFR